jgi:HK97 gp10 family phage protein
MANGSAAVLGTQDLERALKQLGIKASQDKKQLVQGAARIIKEAAIQNAPEQSGNLKEHIIDEVLAESEDAIEVGVGPDQQGDAFYGLMLEFGADSHTIRKQDKRVLASPEDIFGTQVEHPGLPARPWLRAAFDENIDRAVAEAAAQVKGSLGL